jgi:glyoxylase-like metal-dependent hydrolase (beta-lactamase superfamily II)/rhodanese-related sulfurtransferase
MEIVAIDTPSLGDRGYLATDGAVALVIDAQRDFDRVLDLAEERGVVITHVLETHVHNDYVTGGLALARAVGAQYLVNGADPVSFPRTPVSDGDVIEAGGLRVQVIGTPGHTFTHLAYAVGETGRAGEVTAVFSGGSLLYGSTGRTDLLGPAKAEELSRAQWNSARRLARELPGSAELCPTHGFGSFCSASSASAASPAAAGGLAGRPTIADELLVNPALTTAEPDYVRDLLAGLDAYPAYYAHMGPANLAGPRAADLTPPRRATPAELRRRLDAGEWVADLRGRGEFAAGHLPGALNFEAGPSLATYLGWLIPWGTPLTLIAGSPRDIAAAQRELCRVGIDRIEAGASGPAAQLAGAGPLESFRRADFAALAPQTGNGSVIVLDVRRRLEWQGGHVESAVHIPLHELASRMGEIGDGEVWVHCQSGYRAAIAASMLAAAGRNVVVVDDEFSAATESGLVTSDAAAAAGAGAAARGE